MIRKVTENDLDEILQIEQELFRGPWKREDFLYELDGNPYAVFAVLEEDGEIAGYADWWIMFEQAQLANIAVRKKYQKKGFGRLLLDEALRSAESHGCENMTLEVRVSNEAAIRLYENSGFIIANKRKNYYEDGEDAWLMIKPLGGSQ